MQIKFNEDRALKIFGILNRLWREKKGLYNNIILPQNAWPLLPKEPKQLANYLFFAALPMRGGVVSEDPFKWIWQLSQNFPTMFEPEIVAKEWPPEKIEGAVKRITPDILNGKGVGEKGAGALGYKIDQHSKAWYENSLVLSTYWGGDLRNVFWGVTDFEEAFRRIDNRRNEAGFRGMRRKIFSLLTIWLQEKKLIPMFPTPLPVDFHVLRVFWATEIIELRDIKPPRSFEQYYPSLVDKPATRVKEQLVDQIAKWSQGFLEEHRLPHLNINPAVWVLSRDLCAGHLQNTSRKNGTVLFLPEELRNAPGLWPSKYKNPCHYCPIEKFCTGCVPSVPYYRRGILVRMERVNYPQNTAFLPGIDWKEYIPYSGRRRSKNNH